MNLKQTRWSGRYTRESELYNQKDETTKKLSVRAVITVSILFTRPWAGQAAGTQERQVQLGKRQGLLQSHCLVSSSQSILTSCVISGGRGSQANLVASPLSNAENTGRSVVRLSLKPIIHVECDWEDRSAGCACRGGGVRGHVRFLQGHLLKRYLNVRAETFFFRMDN